MKKSKVIFFGIAAIVLIVILAVLLLSPKTPPADTPSISGTDSSTRPTFRPTWGTNPPTAIGTVPPTGPTATSPIATNPDQTLPFPGTNPIPPYLENIPDEPTIGDFPQSTKNNYMNYNRVDANVYIGDDVYLVSFGMRTKGNDPYIYLTPHVYNVAGKNELDDDYQFCFEPAMGHVVTITNAEYGDHTGGKSVSTFVRAIDYGLPAAYVDADNPGTVWYNEGEPPVSQDGEYQTYIDVRIYKGHALFACMRIVVRYNDYMDQYYLERLVDLNQLELRENKYSIVSRLPDEMLDRLVEQVREDSTRDGDPGHIIVPFEDWDDLVIERRSAEAGTYFDYFCTPYSLDFLSQEDLPGTELIAVSVRGSSMLADRSPATYYYQIVYDEERGEDTIVLVGIDSSLYYYRHHLYYSDYPGYCMPD